MVAACENRPFSLVQSAATNTRTVKIEKMRGSFGVGQSDVGSEADHAEAADDALTAPERRAVL